MGMVYEICLLLYLNVDVLFPLMEQTVWCYPEQWRVTASLAAQKLYQTDLQSLYSLSLGCLVPLPASSHCTGEHSNAQSRTDRVTHVHETLLEDCVDNIPDPRTVQQH